METTRTSNLNEVSFRGIPIPEVFKPVEYEVQDSKKIIDKILSMKEEDRKELTIQSIHVDGRFITDVKLSTNDIVNVETAIALAEAGMLKNYTSGTTRVGGKILRSSPSGKKGDSIYNLPRF